MGAIFINLEPRYTPGSPGAVSDEALARRVARDERESYEHALDGWHGPAEKKRAEELGLGLIVFLMQETAKGWRVEDYITGELWFWPLRSACAACGLKQIECKRGHLAEHRMKGSMITCQRGSGAFVGRARTAENP